jgi:hypothetical protein
MENSAVSLIQKGKIKNNRSHVMPSTNAFVFTFWHDGIKQVLRMGKPCIWSKVQHLRHNLRPALLLISKQEVLLV